MSVKEQLRWAKGGHAEIVRVEGDAIELLSTMPAPPGVRLEAAVEGDGDVVRIKSYGTRKEAEGTFVLKGRLVSATREMRERLAALAAARQARSAADHDE